VFFKYLQYKNKNNYKTLTITLSPLNKNKGGLTYALRAHVKKPKKKNIL